MGLVEQMGEKARRKIEEYNAKQRLKIKQMKKGNQNLL